MGADSPRNRGTQPAWKAAGGGPAPRGPQYKWKKEDVAAPGTGGRRLKQVILLGGTLACLAGIVWLILYLMPTPQPCLVAVSADPALDADRLDVPLDLYGWQTANEFLKLGQQRAEKATRWVGRPPTPPTEPNGGPLALPATEADLPEWVNRLKSFDPIVLYVGLHGGTNGSGQPFLFAGGRNRLPVAALITALASDPLKAKRKVLILDCGRLAPDPVYGQIHDDFAARVKGLNAAVQACSNLVVMCGASDGQRGWESEELRATSFGHAVLRCLRGEIDTGGNKVITARALFESARQKTREWAQRNRPAVQDPFLLPDGDEGLARAAAIDLGPRPDTPPDASAPGPAALSPALNQLWTEHDRLAGQTPGPASYAPRAWRRYRELLVRYEQAARLGDQPAIGKLTPALTTARTEIERAAVGRLESARGSVALWAAVNAGGVVPTDADVSGFPQDEGKQIGYAARALRRFDNASGELPGRLAELAKLARKFEPPDRRPVEVHLPVMAEDFYATVLGQSPPAPPDGWAAAVDTRAAAERAAAGLPIPAGGDARAAVYTERVWPMTRPLVLAGDLKRRQAEDDLFATDPKARDRAAELLKAANKDYADAAAIAQAARSAFDVRDRVLADLPFLTRWYAGRYSSAKDAADLIDLWDKTHALSRDLDELAAKPPGVEQARAVGKAAAAINERYAKHLADFRAEADRALNDAALQSEWWAKQQLLSVPLIASEKRSAVLDASRHASGRLLADQKQEQQAAPDAQKVNEQKATEVRGRLARAVLGDRLLDAQHEADKTLPKADILDRDLTAIATTADQWTGHAAQAGAGLAGHFARLSATGLAPSAEPDARAERASRSAVPFDDATGWEPAAANERLRWRAYLTDQAERTADDHWYDERQSPVPYYKAVANRFLADAGRMTADLAAGTPAGTAGTWAAPPHPALTAKLDAPPLTARDLAPITWTSELGRTIPFHLEPLPRGYPVKGGAVAVGRFADAAPIHAAEKVVPRPLLPIPNGPLGMAVELRLDPRVEDITAPNRQAACTIYFRGQRPTQHVQINLRRKPELVIADPPPVGEVRTRLVAVRADRDLELGSVVILLDYSGSMDGEFLKGVTRKQAALKAVANLLKELPRGTPLRIRVFADEANKLGSRVVFGTGEGRDKPEVTWDSDQDQRYKDLIATLEGIKPYAATPLVQSISAAAKQDFSGFTGASKTLLVLTDGAEDDGQKRGENAQAAFIASKGKALADNMAGENVSLHVVQFALTPGERKEADDLFAPLKTDQPGMVRLWPANDVNNLRQALLDAIRPKLKLADRGDNIPAGFPPTGWASRVPDRREPPYDPAKLYWTPRIADDVMGPFKASAYPARLPSTTSLNLLPGELMILGFGNDRPRIRVRRELYADYILNSWAKARSRNELWALSLSGRAAVNDAVSPPEYLSLAFLEQVPPHRRGKGQRDADVGPLAFAHPDLTWWQVTPAAGKGEKPPPAGTVRVTRQYGYPAPGWEVKVEGWPLPPFPAAEYRVWAADAADTDRYASFVQCAVRDEPTTLTTKLGDKLEMRAAIESWQPARADAPVECLVVRFTFDKGKPVFARPVDLPASYSEHRYYGANAGADGMIAYTAVFELPVQQLKSSGVRLKLIPVQPSRTDDNLLLLTPPEPRKGTSPDKGSLPRPSDPVK